MIQMTAISMSEINCEDPKKVELCIIQIIKARAFTVQKTNLSAIVQLIQTKNTIANYSKTNVLKKLVLKIM